MSEIPDITTAGFKEFVDFANRLPRIKPTELHCHPGVVIALRDAAPEPEWQPALLPPPIGTMDLIVQADMEPGEWEIRQDGEVIDSGKLAIRHG